MNEGNGQREMPRGDNPFKEANEETEEWGEKWRKSGHEFARLREFTNNNNKIEVENNSSAETQRQRTK